MKDYPFETWFVAACVAVWVIAAVLAVGSAAAHGYFN